MKTLTKNDLWWLATSRPHGSSDIYAIGRQFSISATFHIFDPIIDKIYDGDCRRRVESIHLGKLSDINWVILKNQIYENIDQ